MRHKTVLVVDDDESLRRVTQMQLEEAGYTTATAAEGGEALRMIEEDPPALLITDLKMPGIGGLELLRHVRQQYPQTVVVLVTAFGTVQTAVEAMKAGAYDYITKPIDYQELLLVVHRAAEHQQLVEEVRTLRASLDQKYGFESITGQSKELLQVLEMAARVAQRDCTVLLRGETGTGKELLARAIHQNSRRKDQPFVTINCGAIPKDLMESELFGHAKGSFTGAFAPKRGKVESADGGTLFLDEIGELARGVTGQVAAPDPAGRNRKGGRSGAVERGCQDHRGDPSQSAGSDRGRHLSRGSVLPAGGDSTGTAAAARAHRRYSRTGAIAAS